MILHPKISTFQHLTQLATPASGWRMPAEWEPQEAVWVVPPHNRDTWSGCLAQAQAQHTAWCEAMQPYVRVRATDEINCPTFDSWIRDFGPLFVLHQATQQMALHDFFFNSWGEKYEGCRDVDNVVPQHIAAHLDVPIFLHNMVLEGGSIEVNGKGMLLTTAQCLESASRNPHLSREEIEQALQDNLGIEKIGWLPGGIAGDDTDGHIDDIARFVTSDRAVCVAAPDGHADHAICQANLRALRAMRDTHGAKLEVVELPVPDPIYWHFESGNHYAGGGKHMLPASYANFLISNGAMFVPIFGQHTDDIVLPILEQASGLNIIPIRAEYLVVGLGALHCLSMQQPALPQ